MVNTSWPLLRVNLCLITESGGERDNRLATYYIILSMLQA